MLAYAELRRLTLRDGGGRHEWADYSEFWFCEEGESASYVFRDNLQLSIARDEVIMELLLQIALKGSPHTQV